MDRVALAVGNANFLKDNQETGIAVTAIIIGSTENYKERILLKGKTINHQ